VWPADVGWYLAGTALLGILCLLAIDDRATYRPPFMIKASLK
jgi:hypothetical protein